MKDRRASRRAFALSIALSLACAACARETSDLETSPDPDGSPSHGDAGAKYDATPLGNAGSDATVPDAASPFDAGASPPPTGQSDDGPSAQSCTRNADCTGYVADAGPDGDIGMMCALTACNAPSGICLPTAGCDSQGGPVCGCDGVAYSSLCAAFVAGAAVDFTGCMGNADGGRP